VPRSFTYDYLVVGAGLFGATCARELTDRGKRVVVIDRRPVVAGHAHSETVEGIEVHSYGPHVFHTNSDRLWQYVQRFSPMIPFILRVKAMAQGKLYSLPINLDTVERVFGVENETTEGAQAIRDSVSCRRAPDQRDAESWLKENVGERMYELFFKGYTTKQWKRSPALLDESIVRRIPVRWTERNDRYFDAKYEGLPANGYTELVKQMLQGIEVQLNTDFRGHWREWRQQARTIIYSGAIDELFGYALGPLEYRTTRFVREIHEATYQGCSSVNHCDLDVPFTRTTEYRYFPPNDPTSLPSVVVKEFPVDYEVGQEPHYPIADQRNLKLAARYIEMAEHLGLVVGGRLGRYKYYDMDQVIASALETVRKLEPA
jgi:UDP-galactopyranose mutase